MVKTRSLSIAHQAEMLRRKEASELMTGVMPAYTGMLIVTLVPHFVVIPAPVQLVPISMLLLYIGCHVSLRNLHRSSMTEENQKLAAKDAYMFPVFGSIALCSLYAAYKFLPTKYLNILISGYFFLVGMVSMASFLKIFISTLVSLEKYTSYDKTIFQFRLPKLIAKVLVDTDKPDDDLIKISMMDIPCFIVSAAAALWYLLTKDPLSNNLFGVAFSIQALSLITVDSFWAGAALLIGLFFYDIFFVFGTDIMVTVATKFDAPIKLLFPRGVGERPSMLGLGDIVIPGIFLSLMLRLDHDLHCKSKHQERFSKPYFLSCCFGYLVGIGITLYIMYTFEHAQPALLYLVPGCLLSVILCSLVRGEFMLLMGFKDEHEIEDHAHDE